MDPLGIDLSVVPFLAADDAAELDLGVRANAVRPNTLAVLKRSLPSVRSWDDDPGELSDLATSSGRKNLAQALILRLLTPRGSLAALGHAAYGSRLGELIGQRKTEAARALCRVYVLEAVAQEPRVEDRAVALDFDVEREGPSSFVFTLAVQPRAGMGDGEPVGVSLEVPL